MRTSRTSRTTSRVSDGGPAALRPLAETSLRRAGSRWRVFRCRSRFARSCPRLARGVRGRACRRGGARTIHAGGAAAHRMALHALDHFPVALAHAFVVRLADVAAASGSGPVVRGPRGGGVGALPGALRGALVALGRAGVLVLHGALAALRRAGVLVLRVGRRNGERQREDRKCDVFHRGASVGPCALQVTVATSRRRGNARPYAGGGRDVRASVDGDLPCSQAPAPTRIRWHSLLSEGKL